MKRKGIRLLQALGYQKGKNISSSKMVFHFSYPLENRETTDLPMNISTDRSQSPGGNGIAAT